MAHKEEGGGGARTAEGVCRLASPYRPNARGRPTRGSTAAWDKQRRQFIELVPQISNTKHFLHEMALRPSTPSLSCLAVALTSLAGHLLEYCVDPIQNAFECTERLCEMRSVVGESGTDVSLLKNGASAPWCPSHAGKRGGGGGSPNAPETTKCMCLPQWTGAQGQPPCHRGYQYLALPSPCVTFRRVVVPLRGPGQPPVLPFACCVGLLLSVSRCGRCSCWCYFRVRGAQ